MGNTKQVLVKSYGYYVKEKGVEIHEAEACPDHIHMLVSIPPKLSISSFMGYLRVK